MNVRFTLERMAYTLSGRPDYRLLDKLRLTQWWPMQHLEELQLRYLRDLIEYVYAYVPFYRDWMKANGLRPEHIASVADLSALPVVDKALIRDRFGEFLAEKPRGHLSYASTSGSTGVPFRYLRDPIGYSFSRAVALRNYEMAGFRLGTRFVDLTGNILHLDGRPSRTRQGVVRLLRNFIELPAWAMDENSLTSMVKSLNEFRPLMVRGYPSALFVLARHILAKGGLRSRPGLIVSYAETLFPHQRKTIKEAFGAPVRDTYGCSEGNVGGECTCGNMHIAMENVIVEQLDSVQTEDGLESSELILTFLHTHSFPLIRYRVGDWGALRSIGQCPCGRRLPVLSRVIGRTSDFIIAPGGRVFSPPGVENWFREAAPLIKEFQLVQESLEQAILYVVPDPCGFDDVRFEMFLQTVRTQLSPLRIQLKLLNRLPVSPVGKRRPIVSRLSPSVLTDICRGGRTSDPIRGCL